ncbi:hypothetical protein BST83_15670 [Polaribacter filamentus]|uniref:Uncharacterized protein n=1 Tax=Polaribacter filamentus TaxID=53483 RepID=A0A2S7L0K4_9FLAO|nr:hypothetical protein BST83_15670 [Polaribacter filamentus]
MKKETILNYLNQIKSNVIFTLVVMILSFSIGQLPDLPNSIGFGGFIPMFTPPFIAILTLVIYFFSRIFILKWNWIITIIGAIYNLHEAFDWYFYYKNYK